MAQVYLRLFGRFGLSRASGDEIAIPGKKAQALLAYLALNQDHRRSRAELAALLWSDRGEEQARHSLRQTTLTLRQVLEDDQNTILVSENGIFVVTNVACAGVCISATLSTPTTAR